MDNNLYIQIVDFVFICKKLQYLIKKKYAPESKESLLREFGLKNIPRNGEIEFNDSIVTYWIHGSGITYTLESKEFSHTFWLGKGLDIIFNLQEVLNYHKIEINGDLLYELDLLEEKGLVEKLHKESAVYFLV